MAVKLDARERAKIAFGDFLPSAEALQAKERELEAGKKRGGARPGAGRKRTNPAGAKVWAVRVTDEEKAALIAFLAKMRGAK